MDRDLSDAPEKIMKSNQSAKPNLSTQPNQSTKPNQSIKSINQSINQPIRRGRGRSSIGGGGGGGGGTFAFPKLHHVRHAHHGRRRCGGAPALPRALRGDGPLGAHPERTGVRGCRQGLPFIAVVEVGRVGGCWGAMQGDGCTRYHAWPSSFYRTR